MKKQLLLFLMLLCSLDVLSQAIERTENGTSIDDGANNPVNEGEAQAFDNNNGSKWLIFNPTGNIGYDFASNDAYAINSYSITSGNDAPDRDPKNWNLQGSNDGSNWTNVDSQNNQIFGNRSETKTYSISNTTAYQMYRLNVTVNNGSGLLQIGEIQMFSGSGGGGGTTPTERTENGISIDDGANNPVGEGEAEAFDNNNGSKWLIFNPTGNIGYDFANNDAYAINSYSVTSGNDAPDRDPKNWNLQGSNDGSNWTNVDSQNNQIFGNRSETKTYNISNTTAYRLYRLNVTANNGSGLLQIGEIQMFSGSSGGCTSPTPTLTSSSSTVPANLSASGCSGTVNWSNGGTGNSIFVTSAGTYTATCTTLPCTVSGNGSVTVSGGGGASTDRTENGTSIDDGANNPVGEGEAQAFDNNNGSKWLIFNSTGNIGYDFANNDTYAINSYSVISGNDAPDRDPKNWNLQGSNDGSNWTNLDSQNNQVFGNRSETKTYNISNTTAYQMYRLNITANNGSGLLQIGEIQMFGPAGTGGGPSGARLTGIQGLQDVGCINPVNNPNLDPNWDWKTRTFNLWYNNRVAITPISNTLSPFWDENNPVVGKQNPNIDGDFFPEDGWMLVIRDFGTPTCAPLYPYFVLYNKYKGIMRVCVYKAVQLVGQSQSLSLSFFKPVSGSRGDANMFTFVYGGYGSIETKRAVQNIIAENVTPTSPIDAVNWGWICGDFNVQGYDPNLNNNTLFQIGIKENISLDANLRGKVTANGKATPNLSTDGGGLSGKAVLSFAKATTSAIKDLATPKVIARIAGGVGIIDAALSLVTSILGTNQPNPVDYSITLKGDVDLTGKITADIPVDLKTFYLTPGARTDYNSVVQSIPWGLINYNGDLGFNYTYARTPDVGSPYTYSHNLSNWSVPPILHNPQSGTTIQSVALGQVEEDLPISVLGDGTVIYHRTTVFDSPQFFQLNFLTDWFIRGWTAYPQTIWVETRLSINTPTRSLGNTVIIRRQLPLPFYNPEIYGLRISALSNTEDLTLPYPNPSPNEVNIPFTNAKGDNYELNISSVDGKKIHNKSGIADVPNMNIPWSGETGNYVVETIVNGIRKTSKISIIK